MHDIENRLVSFTMGGMAFEYETKEPDQYPQAWSFFKSAARVFFDYDRIEFYDDTHSDEEPRYDTIGDTSQVEFTVRREIH